MPCIFCIAVFTVLAGQVTTAVVDQIVKRLERTAVDAKVERTVDTGSVAQLHLDVKVKDTVVPVAVTVLKQAKRVRIQVLSHDLDRADADKLQNHLADVLDLKIIERSDPESERLVHDAMDELDHLHDDGPGTAGLPPTPEAPRR